LRDGLIGLAAGMVLISSASYALLVRGLLATNRAANIPLK
jgi:UDP-N-acetylmuramyl pentapeptide phosphotransferase/UDP-N-acetylglucosamine-1-phosphate transferase